MPEEHQQRPAATRGDRWFLLLIFLLFVFGCVVRGYSYLTQPGSASESFQQQRSRDSSQKAFPGQTGGDAQGADFLAPPAEDDFLDQLAPYLTEGGLSFFIGFCIGYVLRLIAKTAIVLTGALYICLIVLSHYGMITVDWGSVQHALQQLLFNAQTHAEGVRGMVAVTLPSAVMGGIGMWRGFRKT